MSLMSISGIPSEVKEEDIKLLFNKRENGDNDSKILKFQLGTAVISAKSNASKGTCFITDLFYYHVPHII